MPLHLKESGQKAARLAEEQTRRNVLSVIMGLEVRLLSSLGVPDE